MRKWGVVEAFRKLGADTNYKYAWSAQSIDKKTTVLTLWTDEIDDDGINVKVDAFGSPSLQLWTDDPKNRTRIRHLQDVWNGNKNFRAIMLVAKDPEAHPRTAIGRWPDEDLLLTLEDLNIQTGEFRASGRRKMKRQPSDERAKVGRKFAPLQRYLAATSENQVRLTIKSIQTLVGELPNEALTPQFWANTNYHLSRRNAWRGEGFKAFYEPSTQSVRFERELKTTQSIELGWSDAELEVCVRAYRKLWEAQEEGVKLNKSALRRAALETILVARNASAYEKRMQNISAVIAELGIDWVQGYAPLPNMGAVKSRIKEMVKRYWKSTSTLSLLSSASQIRHAFKKWQKALLNASEFEGHVGWLPEYRIAIGAYGDAPDGKLNNVTALGIDPAGQDWAVHINIPKQLLSENSLSAIGKDGFGNLYLLRQGRLQTNKQSDGIFETDFLEASGLNPATVVVGDKPAMRLWYVVTPIMDDPAEMCARTAAFVDVCASLRGMNKSDRAQARTEIETLEDLFGRDESGGSSTYSVVGGDRVMNRRHGEVWKALQARLAQSNCKLQKPRSARGYETDGVIENRKAKVLIEIKTGASAADVYTGIGQLQVYSHLLPKLTNHRKVLLIPKMPAKALIAALGKLGIDVHCYNVVDDSDWSRVEFPNDFLKACRIL